MLTVERTIAAPPSAVWDILVDLAAWPAWGPSITGAQLDGASDTLTLGSTGHVTTAVGLTLPFVVTEFESRRLWAWNVAGVTATRHRVDAIGTDSRVVFEVPLWAAAYAAVCALALRRIEHIVAR